VGAGKVPTRENGRTVMTMSGGVDDAIADPSIFKLGDRVCAGWVKPLTRPAVFFGRNG
jgi:hypothetical protein